MGTRSHPDPPAGGSRIMAAVAWVFVVALGVAVVVFGVCLPEPSEQHRWGETLPDEAPVTSPNAVPELLRRPSDSVSLEPARANLRYDDLFRAPSSPDAADPLEELEELPADGSGAPASVRPDLGLGPSLIERVPADDDGFIVHIVSPVEFVDQIAYRYAVRPSELRMWNGIRAKTLEVRAGARLRVRPRQKSPPRLRIEHVVAAGESWWSIGITYGVDSRELRALNRRVQQRLEAGQRLEVWVDPVVYQSIAVDREAGRGPTTVRPGAVGIGLPQDGRLVNGVELPASPYYVLNLPPSSYGTSHAVAHLLEAIVRFNARYARARPLLMGTMSRRHGGPITGHVSHQTGRDLDVRLPLRRRFASSAEVKPGRVDGAALWHLIAALGDTDEVLIIFLDYDQQKVVYEAAKRLRSTDEERARLLQYPRGHLANLGLVRHASGHVAHIHVRFTCGPAEPECVTGTAEDPGD